MKMKSLVAILILASTSPVLAFAGTTPGNRDWTQPVKINYQISSKSNPSNVITGNFFASEHFGGKVSVRSVSKTPEYKIKITPCSDVGRTHLYVLSAMLKTDTMNHHQVAVSWGESSKTVSWEELKNTTLPISTSTGTAELKISE